MHNGQRVAGGGTRFGHGPEAGIITNGLRTVDVVWSMSRNAKMCEHEVENMQGPLTAHMGMDHQMYTEVLTRATIQRTTGVNGGCP